MLLTCYSSRGRFYTYERSFQNCINHALRTPLRQITSTGEIEQSFR